MSSIDNIINKLKEDSHKQNEKIIENAESEAKKLIDEAEKKAREEYHSIIRKAETEKEQIKSKAISSAELKARDMVLKSKNEIIQKVFEIVLERLNNLPEDDYLKYLKNSVVGLKLSPNAILKVPNKYLGEVKESGLGINISEESIENGFIIEDTNVIYNNKFENIIDSKKTELEVEIFEKLFKD
ncbi:MAG: V-type ATP synthase subunit E [Peptoniphilaceae bacterium]